MAADGGLGAVGDVVLVLRGGGDAFEALRPKAVKPPAFEGRVSLVLTAGDLKHANLLVQWVEAQVHGAGERQRDSARREKGLKRCQNSLK